MASVQHQLAFARPFAVRVRSVRRPFKPSPGDGIYRLPHDVHERLISALAPFKNRQAAFALGIFLARYWSVPGRVMGPFPIDRRALADHANLELTEARVRGAIRTLEAVAFLERAIPPCGSQYKPTAEGLHRKPILYVFGSEYGPAFVAANKRAQKARGGNLGARRPSSPTTSASLPLALSEARRINSPKNIERSGNKVIMGEISEQRPLPPPITSPTPLEAALERLRKAIIDSRKWVDEREENF